MNCFIIANGEIIDYAWHRQLLLGGEVICADGGANHAYQMGILPQLVIGDLDSVTPVVKDWLVQNKVPILAAACAKDETDTLLAINWLTDNRVGLTEIIILGAFGGRLDHTVGNLQLLLTGIKKEIKIRLFSEQQTVSLITPEWPGEFSGQDSCISLLAYTPEVKGVTTENLHYPLAEATLTSDNPLGISNRLIAHQARVTVQAGILLAFENN